ncbi:hypothetical protein BDV36DRAFT_159212 [Aspergillus pseudocaelatus]|uniref:Uncharacterized protein n=1 Tax=Aspergillus pseudocaelatus TaxID=1825620 RepID=A0ABQ6WMT4_9EURO|nr:hypothetical protein BDV36DRAFT_159212 [Aspergillus pseudocaelatus]
MAPWRHSGRYISNIYCHKRRCSSLSPTLAMKKKKKKKKYARREGTLCAFLCAPCHVSTSSYAKSGCVAFIFQAHKGNKKPPDGVQPSDLTSCRTLRVFTGP